MALSWEHLSTLVVLFELSLQVLAFHNHGTRTSTVTTAIITDKTHMVGSNSNQAANQARHSPTAENGSRVDEGSILGGQHGLNLLPELAYLEDQAYFNRERIPERVVHAKGGAAYGEFVVTNTEITKYCKTPIFQRVGKKTRLMARFSHVVGNAGVADTERDVRGFAVKFYTDLGNWDLVGNNLPVFFVRDPSNFTSFIHSQKRDLKTHLRNFDSLWGYIASMPETLHTTIMLFSERGTPDGFRHMHGFGVNTFKLVNSKGEAHYAKFHWICGQGIRNLDDDGAKSMAGSDPDYALRDLQLSIMKGEFPYWTLKVQIMSLEEARQADFDVLDATKTWPHAKWPLIEVGRMTLNQNVVDYFAEVEQLAFSPANMVPGIEPSPDRLLLGRMVSYPDAQRYRLGINYADLPVNQAVCPMSLSIIPDGATYTRNLRGGLPNPVPGCRYSRMDPRDDRFIKFRHHFAGHLTHYNPYKEDNYSQAKALVERVMSAESRRKLATNIAGHLKFVQDKKIIEKVLRHLKAINETLGLSVEAEVQKKLKS